MMSRRILPHPAAAEEAITLSLPSFLAARYRERCPPPSFVLGWAVLMPLESKQLGKQIVAGADRLVGGPKPGVVHSQWH
jgi:hypothetical protein